MAYCDIILLSVYSYLLYLIFKKYIGYVLNNMIVLRHYSFIVFLVHDPGN
jgi:hypothetical protein